MEKFNFVGLGLGGLEDVTLRGLTAIEESDLVLLENYTSIVASGNDTLQEALKKRVSGEVEVKLLTREAVEGEISEADTVMSAVNSGMYKRISFCVVGDVFAATTHSDLYLRIAEAFGGTDIISVINNASIMTGCSASGLQLYRFGETVSVPYFTDKWRPYSFLPKIFENYNRNLHTLVLLDIKVREIDYEIDPKVYQPARFMSVNEALKQLLEACSVYDNVASHPFHPKNAEKIVVVGLARVGDSSQKILSGTVEEMLRAEFGGPLHSLIVPSPQLHDVEAKFIDLWKSA